jgi:hypothetical protein
MDQNFPFHVGHALVLSTHAKYIQSSLNASHSVHSAKKQNSNTFSPNAVGAISRQLPSTSNNHRMHPFFLCTNADAAASSHTLSSVSSGRSTAAGL